jgi:hypothetical protein
VRAVLIHAPLDPIRSARNWLDPNGSTQIHSKPLGIHSVKDRDLYIYYCKEQVPCACIIHPKNGKRQHPTSKFGNTSKAHHVFVYFIVYIPLLDRWSSENKPGYLFEGRSNISHSEKYIYTPKYFIYLNTLLLSQ